MFYNNGFLEGSITEIQRHRLAACPCATALKIVVEVVIKVIVEVVVEIVVEIVIKVIVVEIIVEKLILLEGTGQAENVFAVDRVCCYHSRALD